MKKWKQTPKTLKIRKPLEGIQKQQNYKNIHKWIAFLSFFMAMFANSEWVEYNTNETMVIISTNLNYYWCSQKKQMPKSSFIESWCPSKKVCKKIKKNFKLNVFKKIKAKIYRHSNYYYRFCCMFLLALSFRYIAWQSFGIMK